jgi:prepilin-type N-terminal cleavage/methylation domain-containing protein
VGPALRAGLSSGVVCSCVGDNPRPARRASPTARRAFTLIELIIVLALLAIGALVVVSRMSGFFRGRVLNHEARRILSLTQYGQSRAVSEGVPVVLWIDPKTSTYGLAVLSSYNIATDPDGEGDPHAVTYNVDPSLTLETPTADLSLASEQDDEKLGLAEGISAIRFNPDGFIDETSVRKITIRLDAESALEVGPTASGLSYEIRPASD